MVSKKMQLCSGGLLVVCPFLFLLMKSFIAFYMGEAPRLNPDPPVYDLSILPCTKNLLFLLIFLLRRNAPTKMGILVLIHGQKWSDEPLFCLTQVFFSPMDTGTFCLYLCEYSFLGSLTGSSSSLNPRSQALSLQYLHSLLP